MRRRQFLAAAGAAAGAALAADVFAIEPNRLELSRHDVAVSGLPAALNGLRIAQVSDLHLPACRRPADSALTLLERERPEVVVHTGDALEHAAGADDLVALAPRMRGTLATAAVLGNWEYRGGLTPATAAQVWERAGVPLLVNSHLLVRSGGATLALAGLDDLIHGRPDLAAARDGIPSGVPEVWLGHEPAVVEQLSAASPPVVFLSGHTHGGQIRIPGMRPVTPIGSGRFLAGWYRDTPVPLYVGRGIGTADVRARFRCPPELPIFRLVRA
ncbi:MAG TPA: metallophosphoesterase [Gemmatimonadales bacterium]|nr:metallophosphoesterase [Gemmatimonadales bacterium]